MSRSRKLHPVYKKNSKGMKALANKTVRHAQEIPKGKRYKKFFNSYDICDYSSHSSKKVWLSRYKKDRLSKRFASEKEAYREWRKWFKNK